MNNIENTTRNSFFPNSRDAANTKQTQRLKTPYLQRNDSKRKEMLDAMAHQDSKVSISNAVKDFSRIKKAIDAAPEIDNSEKIARLKAQINNGTYQVDYEALADKILASEF